MNCPAAATVPSGAYHAQQTFVMRRLARARRDDRLIGEDEAVVVEGFHDLVCDTHEAQARRLALGRFDVSGEPVAAGAARAVECFFRTQHRFLTRRGARRQRDGADTDGCRHRTAARRDHFAAHHRTHAIGHERDLAVRAFGHDDAELIARRASDDVAMAQHAGNTFAHRQDHFVRRAEAIGFVDRRETVDRGHEIGATARFGLRRFDGARQFRAQARAVQMAREFVARREIGQSLRFAFLFGDDAQDAGETLGAAVGPGNAHAAHLEPHRAHRGGGLEFEFKGCVVERAFLDDAIKIIAALR